MTTVEEDLLLNEPVVNDYENNLTVIDEDLLLGADDISRRETTEDAAALLLVDPVSDEDQHNKIDQQEQQEGEGEGEESEKEELDYDEEEDDEDKRERTSRYTSEKKGGAVRLDSEDGEDSKKENSTADGKAKRPGIPSLFDKTITNNPMKSGDQPIGVTLRIEGEADRVFYPPPAFMTQLHQQPIVPRLPNGIPLIGMPVNHGRAGFGMGYQQQQQQMRLVGGGGVSGMSGQWDNEVARFLSSANSSKRGGRSSRKRRSSSYSSASSYSSDSRSRSRSSSRSDRRRRDSGRGSDDKRRRRDDRRETSRRDDRKDDRRRGGEDRRRHDDRRSERHRKEQSRNSALESAKALGLSNDYLNQMNEQKRRREEILKKKEERRHGPTPSEKKDSSLPPPSTSSTTTTSSAKDSKEKSTTKAYLAVNVCGVQQLPTAVKKIEALAVDLGPIKKCWRSADDVVSIIFNAHDKAKDFMIKYNGKVLSGLRITVALEKKFLNLAEVN